MIEIEIYRKEWDLNDEWMNSFWDNLPLVAVATQKRLKCERK